MRTARLPAAGPFIAAAALAACSVGAQTTPAVTRPVLASYDFQRRAARFDLPGRLDEISGLAFTSDGRLFGHDDERATLHEIDPRTGEVGKRFSLGDPPRRGDFEGLAIAGERFFMVTSRGVLYEFREGRDRDSVPYRVTDTELGAHCEVEGLDHSAADDALLVACKQVAPDRDRLVVHRVPLGGTAEALAPIEIPKGQLARYDLDLDFEPSAVAVSPAGSLILVSASSEALIEVDEEGRVLAAVQLDRDRHSQPEGLDFGPDGTMYIADEENERDARLTAYRRAEAR